MNLFVSAAALATGLVLAAATPAAVVDFSVGAGGFGPAGIVSFQSTAGRFETAGDDGTFTLDAGLTGFALAGDETVFEFGGAFRSLSGAYAFAAADLVDFSATLAGGTVTALSFATRPAAVPLDNGGVATGESDTVAFSLDSGSGDAAATVASDRYGEQDGAFSIDAVTPSAVPEPATWATLVAGFALAGGAMRRRRAAVSPA